MGPNNRELSDIEGRANSFLGTRLRELRAGRRMSQTAVAEAMAERGFPWHQPTVHRIESGRQAAAFWEVVALAEIFGVPLETFQCPGQVPA